MQALDKQKLTIFILPLFCRSRHKAIKPDHKKEREREVDNHVSSQSSTKDLVLQKQHPILHHDHCIIFVLIIITILQLFDIMLLCMHKAAKLEKRRGRIIKGENGIKKCVTLSEIIHLKPNERRQGIYQDGIKELVCYYKLMKSLQEKK